MDTAHFGWASACRNLTEGAEEVNSIGGVKSR